MLAPWLLKRHTTETFSSGLATMVIKFCGDKTDGYRSLDLCDLFSSLGCFFTSGDRGAFWLNILLTLLGYFPGVIHAVWVIAKED
ncbi:YqaE/Pmp3 family membrane protein [Spirulina sp. CCNP1310]|uniref:YqaE/Pmp3 family membrane protein n=1 Tax=Spirulina sp. CCNP1310 TaxID=3110249 RepID=UPI002B21174F|nr:YqaE/Pmp3 family membrane protein [Spirulina sp. CCNP1310]MEA5420712.1 YqaE/Pmp3 family membrane protein [Spirulina sp. CCNP1310]